MKKFLTNKPQIIKVVIFIIIFLLISIFLFNKFLRNDQDSAAKEVDMLVSEIGKAIELPDEIPVVATVSDKNSLSKQDFFSKAENGDKVLIYQTWQKAILYRPSLKKIIDLTSINTSQSQEILPETKNTVETTPETDVKAPTTHRVALYNGSLVNGLTQISANKLNQEDSVSIVARENASKTDYPETLVIPLRNTSNSMAVKIAEILAGKVAELPNGETLPDDADILVILAQPANATGSVAPVN